MQCRRATNIDTCQPRVSLECHLTTSFHASFFWCLPVGTLLAAWPSPGLDHQFIYYIKIFPSCSKKQPTKRTTKHTKTYKNQEAEKVLRCWSLPFCFSWVFHCGDRVPSSHDSCNSPSHPWSCAKPPGFHLNGREQQGWNTWGPWNFPKILLGGSLCLKGMSPVYTSGPFGTGWSLKWSCGKINCAKPFKKGMARHFQKHCPWDMHFLTHRMLSYLLTKV